MNHDRSAAPGHMVHNTELSWSGDIQISLYWQVLCKPIKYYPKMFTHTVCAVDISSTQWHDQHLPNRGEELWRGHRPLFKNNPVHFLSSFFPIPITSLVKLHRLPSTPMLNNPCFKKVTWSDGQTMGCSDTAGHSSVKSKGRHAKTHKDTGVRVTRPHATDSFKTRCVLNPMQA